MTRTGLKRLLRLADFLEKLPRNRFDYSEWVGEDWEGDQDLSCGTTACALGWATTIPSLRKAGLRLSEVGSVTDKAHCDGFEAAAKVFDVTVSDAQFLFQPSVPGWRADLSEQFDWDSPSADATAKQVAKHIRRFVKVKEVSFQ